jgi:TetR/AcrR family transcriptional repressor of nem operon
MQNDTATHILDVAQQLIMVQGYNGFSFADISERVGITKASILYHFPSKSDLVKQVVARYRTGLGTMLAQIERDNPTPFRKLELYTEIYLALLPDADRVCVCAILAADFPTLPAQVRAEVKEFYSENEKWLAMVLKEGAAAGTFHLTNQVEVEARLFLAGLQGAMLNARAFGDISRFHSMCQQLLQALTKEIKYG